jgi:DNA-binding response OmpR family regulator
VGQASILLVEDEALIRMMLVEMVEELGHKVIAEAGSVEAGRSLAEIEQYDLAILDINLQGSNAQPVVEVVRDRGLPFFLLSGYGAGGVPDELKGVPALSKPCTPETLKRTIDFVLSNANLDEVQDKGDEASQTNDEWDRRACGQSQTFHLKRSAAAVLALDSGHRGCQRGPATSPRTRPR